MLTLNICSSSRTTSSLVHFSFVMLTTFRTVPMSETNIPHVNKTHRYVSIWIGHSISCPVDKANPWGMLLSNHIYPHCIHCCLQSSLHTVHLWFHWMAEPTQSQAAPGMVQLSCYTNTQTHTSMSMLPAISFCTFPWARTGAHLTPKRTRPEY